MAFLVLVSACFGGESCDRPYSLVYGVCCLDEDADGICDSDKPVCRRPYIFIGDGCCLDSDVDGICDRDQVVAATVSSTSTTGVTGSSVSTSVAPAPTTVADSPSQECDILADCAIYENVTCDDMGRSVVVHYNPVICSKGKCIYRSSREIAAHSCLPSQVCVNGVGCTWDATTSTTSTLKIDYDFSQILDRVSERHSQDTTTTSTTLPACLDPDGGKKYAESSLNVSGFYDYNDTYLYGLSERCLSVKSLLEYYCVSGDLKSVTYDCPGQCIGGRCCLKESDVCESDKQCCSGICRAVGLTKHCLSG